MKFLRSAFEGQESHQCRTMGLKFGPKEEKYAWTCWSSALQKARQDTGSKRMMLSATGALVVVKHVAPLIAVHIVAPGRHFQKQGQRPGSLIVKAEARANCYVAMGMLRQ